MTAASPQEAQELRDITEQPFIKTMEDPPINISQACDVLFTVISCVVFEKDTSHTGPHSFFKSNHYTQPTQIDKSLPVVTACHPREKGVLAWMV